MLERVEPDWPAPGCVRALTTTRVGGLSSGPYASLNLAQHVGDDPVRVGENRARVREAFGLPTEPMWLEQVHGCDVVDVGTEATGCRADASLAMEPGQVCAVLTADCLPLLLCNRRGNRVAAVHAGWRGLAAGVVEAALDKIQDSPENLLCWLGPAIGPGKFEVGPEVREAFLTEDNNAGAGFRNAGDGEHWYADLYQLARRRLARRGVTAVYGGDRCTFSEPGCFFSFRRDGITGRMATLIWLAP